ncbi:type II toxin-antitoxin system HicB family antitoxin [Microbaculum marinisediminis]|uniref:Type II toxin-antitoxin system HicB family antitoxin n=1 Tax=Microbaculum marinisediminis TaxID=2931392 RepID=A0AAW5QYX1_9HYPH|nr:type II toxin-antitoxin system HicB family antitoxin [Microbaculum sp. A6E488]MCT8973112.1 type II toxin-antitoxin system HicB family antitoxin [Microbaculum sp. A6E488]
MTGYIALIHYPLDGLEWRVSFPDLPACRSSGRSLDEATANAQRALTEHLSEWLVSDDLPPPARTPGEMLLAANDDPQLARRMVGAVLRAIDPYQGTTLRHAAAGMAAQYGFYGEERPRRRA